MFISRFTSSLSGKLCTLACFLLPTFYVLAVDDKPRSEFKDKLQVHQYTVTLNKSLTKAEVKICFDGKAPEYLAVDYKKSNKTLIKYPFSKQGKIDIQGRYWGTKNLSENACIQYKSDISSHIHLPKRQRKREKIISFQSENSWLWLPEKLSDNETAEITFNIPKKYFVSAPWQLIDQQKKVFRIGKTPHDWGFTLMIGEFVMKKLKLEQDKTLYLAMLPRLKQQDELKRWIEHSVNALTTYLGEVPQSHLQVMLLENKRFKSGPVPWGDMQRGGGMGVRFVVNSNQPIEKFYADWTATHEFSHLLIPNIEYKDIWLSEGLASYLQYILMAQSGVITEQIAWQKIYQGLMRGEKGTRKVSPENLIEASQKRSQGGRYGRTMRVYWSGAAYFLKADWLLRKASDGKQGLPDVLNKLNQCCVNSNQEWSGIELSNKLDQLSNTKIFSRLYQQIAYAKNFPNMSETYDGLGIDIDAGTVKLAMGKEGQLRQSITKH